MEQGCPKRVWTGTSNFLGDNDFTRMRNKIQDTIQGDKGSELLMIRSTLLKNQSGIEHVLNVTKMTGLLKQACTQRISL